MSNFFTLFNYASNRPHNSISLEQVCSLVEGVSYFQICKKSTKLGKNIDLLVHFPAAKRTKKCKCKNYYQIVLIMFKCIINY